MGGQRLATEALRVDDKKENKKKKHSGIPSSCGQGGLMAGQDVDRWGQRIGGEGWREQHCEVIRSCAALWDARLHQPSLKPAIWTHLLSYNNASSGKMFPQLFPLPLLRLMGCNDKMLCIKRESRKLCAKRGREKSDWDKGNWVWETERLRTSVEARETQSEKALRSGSCHSNCRWQSPTIYVLCKKAAISHLILSDGQLLFLKLTIEDEEGALIINVFGSNCASVLLISDSSGDSSGRVHFCTKTIDSVGIRLKRDE